MKIPKNFSEWWESTNEGKEAIAQAVEDGTAERTAKVEEIAGLRKALKAALPEPLKAIEVAAKKATKCREAALAAEREHRRSLGVVQSLRHQADTQIGRLEQQLREGAAPAVREFLESTKDVWDVERRTWRWSAPSHNGKTMPAKLRMEQLHAIGQQADRLMLEPDPEVADRELERLRQAVANPLAAVA